ncbi:hypothetical protein [Clostridium perfringens]|uniref:hypothetical protein n=1 Tax=Clostridium perfringens TaxID=1502 RepID=UPI0039E882BA
MNRGILKELDSIKHKELIKKLKYIDNWNEVEEGTLIYNEEYSELFSPVVFDKFLEKNNSIHVLGASDSPFMGSEGWYIYSEEIAKEIDDYYTPKMWIVTDVRCVEDYSFIVAMNPKHLVECWNQSNNEKLTFEEFNEKFCYETFTEVDGFKISLI